MTSSIEIQYQNATFTSNTSTIVVGNGGSFALESNQFLSINGNFPFNALNVSSGSVSFSNTAAGATASGTVSIPVNATSGENPTITVNNFSGMVTISWPTTTGPQYQQLSSGDPISLTHFTG